jgi:hypothetical protein
VFRQRTRIVAFSNKTLVNLKEVQGNYDSPDLVVLPNLLGRQRVAGGCHGGLPEGNEHPDQDGEGEEEGAALYLHKYWLIKKTIRGDFFGFFLFMSLFNTASSAAPRFHCVGGCWDRTQDCYDFGMNSQTI